MVVINNPQRKNSPLRSEAGRDEEAEHTKDFSGSETTLCDTIIIDIHHYIMQAYKTYNIYVTSTISYELWVVMMYQCGFINWN